MTEPESFTQSHTDTILHDSNHHHDVDHHYHRDHSEANKANFFARLTTEMTEKTVYPAATLSYRIHQIYGSPSSIETKPR